MRVTVCSLKEVREILSYASKQRNNIQKVVKDTIGPKCEEDSTGHLHG